MKKLIRKLFSLFTTDPAERRFVTLMQVALETPEIRDQLISILTLPENERTKKIRKWQGELAAESAPSFLSESLDYLNDNATAVRALEVLTSEQTRKS